MLDYVDRLSVSYRDRASIVSSRGRRALFTGLGATSARFERRTRSRHFRTIAAGWTDARELGADWVPITFEAAASAPRRQFDQAEHDVLFFGNLEYPPNIEAAERIARIWPDVISRRPGTSMLIAGANPGEGLIDRARMLGWSVDANFDDLASVLGSVRLCISPLLHASGIQTKVLEAAAFGLPQVVGSAVMAGFEPGFPVVVATDDRSLVDAVVTLLDDPSAALQLGRDARSHMIERYTADAWTPWANDLLAEPCTAPTYSQRWRSLAAPYATLRVSGQATEFLGFLVLARVLEPSGFGEVSIAFLICRYAGLIGDWGAITRGSRDVAAAGRHGSTRVYVRHRTMVTLLMVAVVATAMAVAGYAELIPCCGVIATLGLNRDWIALGREQGPRAAAPPALQGVVLLALSFFASTTGGGAIAIGTAYASAAILSMAINRIPDEPGAPSHRSPAAWILLAGIAIQVTSTVDALLLGLLRSSAEAGIYAAINRLPNAWIALLTALMFGALPVTTRAAAEDPVAYRALRRSSTKISALLGLLVLLAAPVAYVLVPLLFGSEYADGQGPVLVLMASAAVLTFSLPLHVFAVTAGRDRRYTAIVATGAALNVGLNLAMIPLWGMLGAALATLIAESTIATLLWFRTTHPTVAVSEIADENDIDPLRVFDDQ